MTADDFLEHRHAVAFGGLVGCYDAATTEDELPGPWVLYRRLTLAGLDVEWGGARHLAAWLGWCWELDPTGCWAVPAAVRVRELACRRAIIRRAGELIRDAAWGGHSPDEYREQLERVG